LLRSGRVSALRILERLRAALRAFLTPDPVAHLSGENASSRLVRHPGALHPSSPWRERPLAAVPRSARTSRAHPGAGRLSSRAVTTTGTNPRFLLAIDDAGEFAAVVGWIVRIGHVRSKDVDLPFLGDVAAHHARLELIEDFHVGARWRIAPEPGGSVAVNGRAVDTAGASLGDGDEVRLAANIAFRFVARDHGSSSARLELGGGEECLGAPRVLLFAPGPGGRVRIGASATRSVPLADLEHEIELVAEHSADSASIHVRCSAGVAAQRRGASEPEVRIALPLALAVTLTVRARGPEKPPFALIFRPVQPAARPSGDASLDG
jgi:hypothetical protein